MVTRIDFWNATSGSVIFFNPRTIIIAMDRIKNLSIGANFSEFNGYVLSVVGDIPVDSETTVVTSSISKCVGSVFWMYSKG